MPLSSKAGLGPEGCGRLVNSAYLPRHLQEDIQGQRVLLGRAEQVRSHADGQVWGSHPAGARVAADVLQQEEQVLKQEEVGLGQLAGHPDGTGKSPFVKKPPMPAGIAPRTEMLLCATFP